MLEVYLGDVKNNTNAYLNCKYIYSPTSISGIIKIKNSCTLLSATANKPVKLKSSSFFSKFVNKITKNKYIDCPECFHLIGITIHPKVAREFEGIIKFNGIGEITSLNNHNITRDEYNVLINNRIKPLTETPQIIKERIRTPGEAIIDIAGLIQCMVFEKKHELTELIKCTWLDGSLSQQSLYNTIELIKIKIGNHDNIINRIDTIMKTLEKEFFVTKRNDNYYGRLFETELSKYIVNYPNGNMLKVRDIVSDFIMDDFLNIPRNKQLEICISVGNIMYKDPPIWRDSLSHANIFIFNSTPHHFIEMIKFKGENSVPLLLSVAVKYIILSQGTKELKNRATQYYMNKILPQRQLINSLSEKKLSFTTDYGLLLPWQKYHPAKNEDHVGFGIRPVDKYIRPSAGIELTEHDAAALANERTIGIGVSGSANVLHFLFRYLQSQNECFPLDDAKLATASWLSYSGGHSFNEAYSVFGFMSEGNFKPLSFNALKTSSTLGEVAIAQAYNTVIEASIELNN